MNAGQAAMLRWFELYLLANMRGGAMVDQALQTLVADVHEMQDACERLASLGLSDSAMSGELVCKLLGTPDFVGAVEGLSERSPLSGSKALRFNLSLWPAFDFQVNVHPNGYAWGMRFVRRPGEAAPALNLVRNVGDLVPWTMVIEEVIARFGPAQPEDRWGVWEDWSFATAGGSDRSARRYLVGFDFALLHRIAPL
jgi:hypothetical protein